MGKKLVIYLYDSDLDEYMQEARKITENFFKEHLGFDDDSFIFIENTMIWNNPVIEKFAKDEKSGAQMQRFVHSVFEDSQNGLSRQIVQIGISENWNRYWYFNHQNYELKMFVACKWDAATNEANFKDYFGNLAKRIEKEKLSNVRFKQTNSFFVNDQ